SAVERRLRPSQQDGRLRVDDLGGARVGHPERQAGHPVTLADDGALAEEHPRGGPGELREDDPGDHGETEDADAGLQDDEDVCVPGARDEQSIADGCHGLDAEEERVEEGVRPCMPDAVRLQQVGAGEDRVRDEVETEEDQEEAWPRGVDEVVIGMALKRAVAFADDGLLAGPADDAAGDGRWRSGAHGAGSRIEVKPDGACGPITSCSSTPSPSSPPRRARQSCWTWRWRGSIGSSSASVQWTPSTTSAPFHWP